MRAAALVMTYGRPQLAELLACVLRQTTSNVPTLVYVDNASWLQVAPVPSVHVTYGPPIELFGDVRAAAVERARVIFGLGPSDGLIILDDDDFYSSRHYERTIEALEREPGCWTGGLAMGVTFDGGPVEYVRGEAGVGQQATWGFRLAEYDAAGGYAAVRRDEDLALASSLGWSNCRPHWHCTHVRRQSHREGISGAANFDRALLRSKAYARAEVMVPRWSAECEALEQWCAIQR